MLKTGDKPLDFTLFSDKNETVTLSSYFGKSNVILYFYPEDDTPGCTTEACDFRDNIALINKKDTVVLGVSPDDVASHQKFISKQNLNFTLLSDPDHKVAEMYGAWGEKKNYGKTYLGLIRSTFIIGKDGLIKEAFYNVRAKGHVARILSHLENM
ncbi:MAG: thioredoxin-dependent thiol peroxidase [Calditrichaeota bacterium]|nr:MAG: thioredoxin-dependent thiol peroxidase [Calditrichota bacterium]